jgi:hypothetical protein
MANENSANQSSLKDALKLCVSVAVLIVGLRYLSLVMLLGTATILGVGGGIAVLIFLTLGTTSIFLAVKTRRVFEPPWAAIASAWLVLHIVLLLISIVT